MKSNNGGDAFPMASVSDIYPGMSLHQWYAGMALQGLRAGGVEMPPDIRIGAAMGDADLMLKAYKEREENEKTGN